MSHSIYELSQQDLARTYTVHAPDHRALELTARKDAFLEALDQQKEGLRRTAEQLKERLSLGRLHPFKPFDQPNSGFDDVLYLVGERDGFLRWRCPLPQGVLSKTDHSLTEDSWLHATGVAASLHLWLRVVNGLSLDPHSEGHVQQIGVTTTVGVRGNSNASLTIRRSPTFQQQMAALLSKEHHTDTLQNRMRDTFGYLWPRPIDEEGQDDHRVLDRQFSVASSPPNWVSLDLPGRSGLGSYESNDRGTLNSHNVDHVFQQLTFLVAVGTACHLADNTDP